MISQTSIRQSSPMEIYDDKPKLRQVRAKAKNYRKKTGNDIPADDIWGYISKRWPTLADHRKEWLFQNHE